jgi:hypothetical protein
MSAVAAYHVLVCALFLVQGCMWNPHNSLHQKQSTHKYVICCHSTHNNGIFTILTRDFSWELYVLLDDGMQCAIETCRSNESVLM